MTICGRTTRRGTPCKLHLHDGKCPVHHADLSARNRAVAAAFAKRDHEAFIAQRKAAGHKGFVATGQRKGWEVANEKARQYRLAHPSGPEEWALDVLAQAGLNHYRREYPVLDGHSLDLAWPESLMAVEINGHQHKASFGEATPRRCKQAEKLATLVDDGWRVLVIDITGDLAAAAEQLTTFARQANQERIISDDAIY